MQIVKSTDLKCFNPARSDLHRILPNGYLPPPCFIKQEDVTGKIIMIDPKHKDAEGKDPVQNIDTKQKDLKGKDQDGKFLPLFQRLVFKSLHPSKFETLEKMSFDYYCPSVESQLENRICDTCGLYFASKKSAVMHMKNLKHKIKAGTKIIRIGAQRKDELMCLFKDQNTEAEDVEWLDSEDFDSNDIQNIQDDGISIPDSMPVLPATLE